MKSSMNPDINSCKQQNDLDVARRRHRGLQIIAFGVTIGLPSGLVHALVDAQYWGIILICSWAMFVSLSIVNYGIWSSFTRRRGEPILCYVMLGLKCAFMQAVALVHAIRASM
jgi:hypothetical protein